MQTTIKNWNGLSELIYDSTWQECLNEHNFTNFFLDGELYTISKNKYGTLTVMNAVNHWLATGYEETPGYTFYTLSGGMIRDNKNAVIAAGEVIMAL